ncbi:hypothetical protein [Rhodopirellula sallentina]|uniref:Uncharacterized protein n=1 Tax=Rhodopirellula sallentina SM41 TaxID=1263870 RepID=M5U1S3_9BACT|nr:hypothetical protein [Rhodopirellula sallentina]EMI55209.1 hypothetical protein RSSM_03346 [Rhodopirellula sallentina SM41]
MNGRKLTAWMNSQAFLGVYEGVQERLRLREAGIDREQPVRKKLERRDPEYPVSKKTPLAWLKSVVSEIDVGQKVFSKKRGHTHPIHLNTNNEIKTHFERLRWGSGSWLKSKWTSDVIASHCSGEETYYFAGSSESYKPYTLVMIDVDCHNYGSLDGALSYLEHLREAHFPNLYFEPSTNGNGGHGYFLLDKEEMSAQGIKPILKEQIQIWLNDVATDFDVELVEVKGLPPELSWGTDQYELKAYKSGVLAKAPRGLLDRFSELRSTTVMTASELRNLPAVQTPKKFAKPNKVSCASAGSVSGHHFTTEHLAGLDEGGKYHAVAQALLSGEDLTTRSRAKVTVLDMAIVLMLGEFFTANMNSDGSMPTARWEGMWRSLCEESHIDRAWDHKRFKLIRDRLSSLGLIEWEDHSYCVGWKKEDGEYVPGRSAKWKLSSELMEQLSSSIDSPVSASSPVSEEEREHPLWEQTFIDWCSSLVVTPDNETIRPTLVFRQPIYLFSPDELTKFVQPAMQFAA